MKAPHQFPPLRSSACLRARRYTETSQIPPVQTGWFNEVVAQRREYVYQHDSLIEHGRAVPAPGRKREHVARLRDPLFASDGETHAPALDQRDLLVRVVVRRRDDVRLEAKAADHQSFAHYHLATYPAAEVFDGDIVPVPMIHRCFCIQIHRRLFSTGFQTFEDYLPQRSPQNTEKSFNPLNSLCGLRCALWQFIYACPSSDRRRGEGGRGDQRRRAAQSRMLVQRDSPNFGLGRVRRKGAFGQTGSDCGFDQVPGRDYFAADVYARRVYGVDDRGQPESQVARRSFERGDRFRVSGPRPDDQIFDSEGRDLRRDWFRLAQVPPEVARERRQV